MATYATEDFRFTTKGNVMYAIELGWPAGNEGVIRSLGPAAGSGRVKSVDLLGANAIQVPAHSPEKYAYAFRIAFEDEAASKN
jgi:alpha-L-fucosidase